MALRLGLVGHGRWGKIIERTLLTFPDVSVTIIAKGERTRAELDGVLIATQSVNHADAALPYIEAGVATFIEKPMATTIPGAERIRQAAKRSGAVVFAGHIYLYHPAVLTGLELLPSLGAIRYVLWEGMNNKPRTDSSVLWDWLPHGLSVAQLVFARDPDSASAWSLFGGLYPQAAVAKFEYGDASFIAETSWLSAVPRTRMSIVCENGTLIFDDKAEQKLALYDAQGNIVRPSYVGDLPLTREMTAFLQAIRLGDADPRQVEMGCTVVRAIWAAQKSIGLKGRSVKI